MTRKASRPCAGCGRRMKLHRGKRQYCSHGCQKHIERIRMAGRPSKRPKPWG